VNDQDIADSAVNSLIDRLGEFDTTDLLASVGALLLIPENAERELRLDQLGRLVASAQPTNDKPAISLPRLRTLCKSDPLSRFAHLEDPAENPFSEAITFFGGSYVVFPGVAENGTYTMARLLRAVFVGDDSLRDSDFARAAYGLIWGTLSLSDRVARGAGIVRGLEPRSVPGGQLRVPASRKMSLLKSAVRLEESDVLAMLRAARLPEDALSSLIVDAGSLEPQNFMEPNSALALKPIVRVSGTLIVVEPTSLTFALKHAVIVLAETYGVRGELATRFCDEVWSNTIESLDILKNETLPLSLPSGQPQGCYREGFFNVDRDKVMYAALVTDDLEDYDDLYGRWNSEGIAERLEARAREAEQALMSLAAPINEVLILFVIESTGRWFTTGFGETAEPLRSPRLIIKSAELRVIAELEGGDQLLLWKYAVAGEAIRETTRIVCFSQLDEYYLYRSKNYSYHLSDDRVPDLLTISPGTGAALILESLQKRDWHAVQSFQEGRLAEVTCLHDDSKVPIYVALTDIGRRVALCVEGFEMPVWILGERDGRAEREIRGLLTRFCEMVGFWLWQLGPEVRSAIAALAPLGKPLLIVLTLVEPEVWQSGQRDDSFSKGLSIEEAMSFEVSKPENSVSLALRPGVRDFLMGPNNFGEREFMRMLLRALRELVSCVDEHAAESLEDDAIMGALDRAAPLGPKKMIIMFDGTSDPTLNDDEVPRWRGLQEADVSTLSDEIGTELEKQGYIAEQVRRADSVARDVVALLFAKLETLARSIRRQELLDELLAMNEALVAHAAHIELTIPTRVACYGDMMDVVEQVMKEQSRLTSTLLASRFLIEYAAAQPGDGPRPMSLVAYDRLVAIAEQIVNWAFIGDLDHYGIGEIAITVTKSRRLGIDTAGYDEARTAYLRNAFYPGHVNEAIESFARRWREPEKTGKPPPLVKQLDLATTSEFGLPLTGLLTLLEEVRLLGESQAGPIKTMGANSAVTALAEKLGWPDDKVERGLELLSLRPRSHFLDVPEPLRRDDVYPWRFNRELSYARRPIVWREVESGWELVWGNRHLHLAGRNLLGLCLGGRLGARSGEMKKFVSKRLNTIGREFNDDVASVFQGRTRVAVRKRVERIGREQMGHPDALGDVDVLVGDEKSREILAIECKDLALARTPRELAHELETLFEGRNGKEPAVKRHQRRVEWLAGRMDAVLTEMNLTRSGSWRVTGLVVVDDEPLSAWVRKSPLPILSLRGLRSRISDW
jgi:hypothetical protein